MTCEHDLKMQIDQFKKLTAWGDYVEALRQKLKTAGWDRKGLTHVGKIALVCIANNEDRYIQEWIDYHFKLGIDEIFIYEHDWRSGVVMDKVHTIPFDGPNRHTYSYNEWLFRRAEGFDWVIFLDVDQFLVLNQHSSIQEFLLEYGDIPEGVDAIAANWMTFGDNGNEKMVEGGVLERFTRRGKFSDRHIQLIVKLNGDRMMMGPHTTFGFWIDTEGNIGTGQNNFNGNCNVIQVNHYFCKSRQEYVEKKLGQERADCSMVRSMEEYDFYNQNEVEDLRAFNFYMVW